MIRSECRIDLHKYWNGSNDEVSGRGEPDKILYLPEHLHWLDDHCYRILDIGCGNGFMVDYWIKKDKDAYGVTYQAEEILNARNSNLTTVAWGDAHKLPYPDSTFDGILMWDVLEHCLSPFIVLAEAHAVTRANGHGLIFIPQGLEWELCKYHILCPSTLQMQHLCALTGWELNNITEYDHGTVYEMTAIK